MAQSGPQRSDGMSERRRRDFIDLYELLEISPRASQDVIHAAYRALARNYHPDINSTAEAASRIRQLNEAYGVLSDPQDRARYDLKCARARRYERLTRGDPDLSVTQVSEIGRSRSLLVRRVAARRPVHERLPLLNGQAILGILLVAALAVFLLIVLWAYVY